MVIQKNRRFGDKIGPTEKIRCIMYTGSYRKIFCYWKRIESIINTWIERVLRKKSRRQDKTGAEVSPVLRQGDRV